MEYFEAEVKRFHFKSAPKLSDRKYTHLRSKSGKTTRLKDD